MEKKNSLSVYREKFGFSQQDFADYLGVSRSLFSLAELGLRQLPATAHFKFMDLLLAYEAAVNTSLPDEMVAEEKQHLASKLQKELNHIAFELLVQQRAYQKLEVAYLNAKRMMQMFVYLKKAPPIANQSENMQAIMQMQERITLRRWRKNNLAELRLLQTKIQHLENEFQAIEQQLKTISN